MNEVVHHTSVILEVRQPLAMLLWGAHVITEGAESQLPLELPVLLFEL